MGRLFRIILAGIVALALWAAFVAVGAREGWWRPMPAPQGDTAGFMRWAQERYAAQTHGNIAIVLLDNGEVAQSYYASHGRAVDLDSLFQVASLSKWLTAWGVMTLVEEGRIDLDAPVSRYLTRWRLPESEFDNEQVTVRRLLSHTAGLTDGLGFLGFTPDETIPSIEQELSDAPDVMTGASGVVRAGATADGTWRYSGGGYLILQLLIEEVTQESFNDYVRRAVLAPLGMVSSTFVDPDPNRLVEFYAADGSEAIHYRFAATGAASLYTSAADLTAFLQAQVAGADGAPPGRGVLSHRTLEMMRTPEARLAIFPVWGLGPTLYAPNDAGDFVIGHDGGNFPAINTTARIDPATGDAIVVLTTGNAKLASEIGGAWTYWQTGVVPLDTLVRFDLQRVLIVFAVGALVILLGAITIAWRGRRGVGAQ